ncbi:hypothetical protein EAKF1_ch4003 [Escherichia albertii KF1]|nr:hypothetical protein EAKF1_ch4003 [Escherichia albertii KF1]
MAVGLPVNAITTLFSLGKRVRCIFNCLTIQPGIALFPVCRPDELR